MPGGTRRGGARERVTEGAGADPGGEGGEPRPEAAQPGADQEDERPRHLAPVAPRGDGLIQPLDDEREGVGCGERGWAGHWDKS